MLERFTKSAKMRPKAIRPRSAEFLFENGNLFLLLFYLFLLLFNGTASFLRDIRLVIKDDTFDPPQKRCIVDLEGLEETIVVYTLHRDQAHKLNMDGLQKGQ